MIIIYLFLKFSLQADPKAINMTSRSVHNIEKFEQNYVDKFSLHASPKAIHVTSVIVEGERL